MSGKHWLERDPSQSPGLQRIKEAQQAATAAKAQAEQQAREAAIAAREERQHKAIEESLVENMTARILPTMREIRDFANRTKTYPLGREGGRENRGYVNKPLELAKPAEVGTIKLFPSGVDIRLLYGFKGTSIGSSKVYDDWKDYEVESVEAYGINVRVITNNSRAEVLVLTEKVEKETIPAKPARSGSNNFISYLPQPAEPEREKIKIVDTWVKIENPLDDELVKHYLGDAFHNPVPLDGLHEVAFRPKPEPQANTGIAGLVKGFLGLK